MKSNLKEELERIHSLTYGKNIQEDVLGKLSKLFKRVDDPKKADIVTDDVNSFYKTLENAAKSGGLEQQTQKYSYQKAVESLQIGLILLGYELPIHGVDGLYGPETAQAVNKFKRDNSILNEETSDIEAAIADTGNNIKGNELESGGPLNNKLDDVMAQIIRDFKISNPDIKITLSAGNDRYHKKLPYNSQHSYGNAIDLTLTPYNSKSKNAFEKLLNSYKSKIANFSFINEYDKPSKYSTGGHFHIEIKSNNISGVSPKKQSVADASPEVINKIIELLKAKNIKPEDIKPYVDVYTPVTSLKGVAAQDFDKIISIIVDNLEGGYYHPNMLKDGRVKDQRYENSGETMFGLDRVAGGELNNTLEGMEFWKIIDDADAKNKWSWNYKGGSLAPKLKALLSKIIKPVYLQYSGYLSKEARDIIDSDSRLTFHFIYAAFNGPTWFRKFAKEINRLVSKGITNPDELSKAVIDNRLNSGNTLIAQGGKKMQTIMNTLTT